MAHNREPRTVGELRRELASYDDDAELHICDPRDGTELHFYRVKCRGRDASGKETLVQIELNEA